MHHGFALNVYIVNKEGRRRSNVGTDIYAPSHAAEEKTNTRNCGKTCICTQKECYKKTDYSKLDSCL